MSTNDMRSIMESLNAIKPEPSLKEKVLKAVNEAFDKKDGSLWLNLIDLITESQRCHGDSCHGRIDNDVEEECEGDDCEPTRGKTSFSCHHGGCH